MLIRLLVNIKSTSTTISRASMRNKFCSTLWWGSQWGCSKHGTRLKISRFHVARLIVFFCLKNKLKIPNRPHTSNNCSELRKSYKQHGYLDKNNSQHTVNFLDVSRHTLNPIEILLSRGSLRDFSNSGSEFPSARHEFLPNYYFHAETFFTTKSDRRGCFKASRP